MVAWTLVFHIVGLVFWLGSLLVVTQILALHLEERTPETRVTLGLLETRLLQGLAHPGAAIMVITGFILVSRDPNCLREHWLQAKLVLVAILVALDLRLTFRARALEEGKIELSRRECTFLHGAISLVFLAVLILVLIKPLGLHRRQAQLGRSGDAITSYTGGYFGENYHLQQWSKPGGRRIHDLRLDRECFRLVRQDRDPSLPLWAFAEHALL